jgi:hypothetical protein
MYTKLSEVVYEGDHIKIFGTFIFNQYANRWEIEDPIAIISGPVEGYIDHLDKVKIFNAISLGFSGLLASTCFVGFSYLLYKMGGRVRSYLIKRRIEEEDRAQRIQDAPPFVREGTDKIEIESFTCS